MGTHKFLVHNSIDDVGVAIKKIEANEDVMGFDLHSGEETWVKATHDISLGHKIALKAIKNGCDVTKYAENIGKATEDIKVGDWVHTHNLKTARWNYGK